MKEYIERKMLLELYSNPDGLNIDNFRVPIEVIRQNIIDQPIADVREVVHGKWINAYPYLESHPMFIYGICSECGAETGCKSNYCHNCGAKMDLELELTEYEEKCLFCKHNYKTLEDIPRCNCMCENHSDFELIKDIKEKFHKENKHE